MVEISKLTAAEAVQWLSGRTGLRVIEFYADWCIYHMLTYRKLEMLGPHLPSDCLVGSVNLVGHEAEFEALGFGQVPGIVVCCNANRRIWVGDTDLDEMLATVNEFLKIESMS
jgi:hypothetical protein